MLARSVRHGYPDLTLFADASFYEKQQVGGWAAWVPSQPLQGGPLPYARSATEAEILALAFGARAFVKPEHKCLILQSDSMNALGQILTIHPNAWAAKPKQGSPRVQPNSPKYTEALDYFLNTLGKRDVIYLRHVRGHQNGVHGRSKVNEACDTLAKKHARSLLQ